MKKIFIIGFLSLAIINVSVALEQTKSQKIEKTAEDIALFSQIIRIFKRENKKQIFSDIRELYEYASTVMDVDVSINKNDAWGDPWLFGVKDGVFFVDSTNYRKWRNEQQLKNSKIKLDPYEDSNFGKELSVEDYLLASDTEPNPVKKRDRIRETQYECEGLRVTTAEFSTDCRRINVLTGAKLDKEAESTVYQDGDYLLDLSENSTINNLKIANIQDFEDDQFVLDADKITTLNKISIQQIKDIKKDKITNINTLRVNDSEIVTLRTLPEHAAVYITPTAEKNILLIANNRGVNIGALNVSVIDNPTFNNMTVTNDTVVGGNVVFDDANIIGVHSSNNLSLNGDIGVAGNIYSNNKFSSGNWTFYKDYIANSGDIKFDVDGLNLSISGKYNTGLSSDSGLNIKAKNINFKVSDGNSNIYEFNDANGKNIMNINAGLSKIGIANSNPLYTLDAGGKVHTRSLSSLTAPNINTTSKGKLLPFTYGNGANDNFSLYSFNGSNINAAVSANSGSLLFENSIGRLYMNSKGVWQLFPLDDDLFHNNGDSFATDMTVGTNDNYTLSIVTNNKPAIAIGSNQITTFLGDINAAKNINDVATTALNNITANNMLMDDRKSSALSIKNNNKKYLNFNSASNQIEVGAKFIAGNSLIQGSKFVVSGGTIDGAAIGSVKALDDIAIGNTTLDHNKFNSTNNYINFNNNELKTTSSVTFAVNSTLDLTGGNIFNANTISVNSINPQNTPGTIGVSLNSGQANALDIIENGNNYLNFDTSNGRITAGKDVLLNAAISGSNFTITDGDIDNVVVGANIPAAASFTTINANVLDGNLNADSRQLSNVKVISGLINGAVAIGNITPLTTISDGHFTITGSEIKSASNTINFSNSISTSGGALTLKNKLITTTSGALTLRNKLLTITSGKVIDAGDISVNSISATTNNKLNINLLDKQITALDITEGANSYLKFDTSNNMLVLGQTFDFNNKDLKNIKIASGTIDGTSIGATTTSAASFSELTVDNLVFDNNTITSANIVLNGTTTISGNLTTTSLNLNGLNTSANAATVNSLSAATNDISIQLTDNRAAALDIKEGTNSYLKFITTNANEKIVVGKTLELGATAITGSNFNITGGIITNADITLSNASTIGSLTFNASTINSSNNIIDFDNDNIQVNGTFTLSATGVGNKTNNADIVLKNSLGGHGNIENIDDFAVNNISPSNATINVNLGTNAAALDIRNGIDSYLTFDTTNSKIIVGKTLELGNTNIIGTNFNIDGGSIDGVKFTIGATNPIQSIKVGSLAFSGNSINSTDASNTIDFGNNDIRAARVIFKTFDVNGDISPNQGVIGLQKISPKDANGQITIALADNNATALDISQGGISYLKFRTTNGSESIDAGSTKFSGSNFNITGGTISGISSISTRNSSFNGNKITSRNGFIDFDDEDLVTKGNISAPSATISSANNSGPVLNITNSSANGPRGIDIDLDNAAANASDFITFAVSGSTVGRIRYDGGVSVINVSDRKTKTHINDTRLDANNILTNLRIVDYNRKNNPNGDLITGFIAQEVQMVFSDMVGQVTPNLLGISEIKLIPILVKGHQQQQTQIDKLNNAIAIGNNKINFNKALNVNNKQVVDIHGNITARDLTIEQDIIVNQKLSIKRSDTLANLMTINKDKTADKTAEGYLSVKDVYLADRGEWLNDINKKVITTNNIGSCSIVNLGVAKVLNTTGEMFVCLGAKGWRIIKS